MANLKVAPQRVPFHSRQIARLIAVAFVKAGWLDPHQQNEALSDDHLPALSLVTPDGREFLITVEKIR
jgi:hypothetical protein